MGIAVTLHPDTNRLGRWLRERKAKNLPDPQEIWAHKASPHNGVTHHTDDWRGSSGLFACAVALKKGHDRIILCGVPMAPNENHYVRKQKWLACPSFVPGWKQKEKQIKPYVRSMSGGYTKELLGEPDADWIKG